MSITAVPLKPVKRRVLVYLWLGIAAAATAALWLAFQTPIDPATTFLAHNAAATGVVQTPSGLQYQVLTRGTGPSPTDEDVTLVTYEGRLIDGTVFERTEQPTPIPVAAVVPGFSEALKLMSKGAKYRVWIKPALGYGKVDKGVIPPNSILVFDLDMIDFKSKRWLEEMQARNQMQQQQGGGGLPPGAGLPPGVAPPPPGEGAPTGR